MTTRSDASTRDNPARHSKSMKSIGEMLRPPGQSSTSELARRLNTDMDRMFAEHQPVAATVPSLHGYGTGFTRPRATKAAQIGSLLNQCLADSVALQMLCRQALWRISGDDRGDKADELLRLLRHIGVVFEQEIDRLAARITELGFLPEGTLAEVTEHCGFKGWPVGHREQDGPVDAALTTLGVYCAVLREDQQTLINYDDPESAGILADISSHMGQFAAEGRVLLAAR